MLIRSKNFKNLTSLYVYGTMGTGSTKNSTLFAASVTEICSILLD